jgi:hypothetical protein
MSRRDEDEVVGTPLRPTFVDKLQAGILVVAVVAIVVVVVFAVRASGAAGSFCAAVGRGSTARAAIASYLRKCGSDYTIAKGPFNGYKSATPYANYAQLVEYDLNVTNNSEGSLAFMEVGQRVAGGSWQTMGRPGTGP